MNKSDDYDQIQQAQGGSRKPLRLLRTDTSPTLSAIEGIKSNLVLPQQIQVVKSSNNRERSQGHRTQSRNLLLTSSRGGHRIAKQYPSGGGRARAGYSGARSDGSDKS